MTLWPRSPWLRHALAIGVALGAMSALVRYRVLGWSVASYLPWVGSAVVALNVLLLLDRFIGLTSGEGPVGNAARRLDFAARLVIVGFAYWAIFVAFNAALDRSVPTLQQAEVLEVGGRTVSLGVPVVYSWASLRLSGGNEERRRELVLGPEEQRRFWRGELLVLGVRSGRFGVPWVFSVERDEEAYCRRALELAPNAVGPWHDLVRFLFEHALLPEAVTESRRFMEAHPDDHEFAYWAGENLNQRGLDAEAVPFLARAAALRPVRYYLYRLAWALTRQGNAEAAIDTLTGASLRYPEAWEFPFLLGYNYAKAGRYGDAMAALKRVDSLNPNVPDVATALARLRQE